MYFALDGKVISRLQSFNLESIQDVIISHKPQVDLAWHLFIYSTLLNPQVVFRHFISSKPAKVQKLPYIPLLIHIILGIVLVIRYQFRALTSPTSPRPEILDITIGITNAVISWRLCKYETRGNPKFARTSFQCLSAMVLFASVGCYWTNSSVWYHALAKTTNAFVYVRWLIKYGAQFRMFSSGHESYTIVVWFGAMLAMMEAKFPWDGVLGVPLFLGFQVVFVIVERRISSMITQENSTTNPFIRLMLLVGLVEVETYKTLKQHDVEDKKSKEAVGSKSQG